MNIIEKARQYAISCHRETNHLYNGGPYEVHLKMVYGQAFKYQHLVPEVHRENFLAAAWTHDVIEDCRQTYNDVKQATCWDVAELTYALTNEKGKNRKERANDKYYEGIKNCPYAVLLKVCDRLANLQYSIDTGSRMSEMYLRENPQFIDRLYVGTYAEAFTDLQELCRASAGNGL